MKSDMHNRHTSNRRERRSAPLPRISALALAGAVGLIGCDNFLSVGDPVTATPESVAGAAALPAVHGSALNTMGVAYTGWNAAGSVGDSQILLSGLLADEFLASGSFPTRIEVDQRNLSIDNATTQTAFRELHRARIRAEEGAASFAEFGPEDPRHAELRNLAGFTYSLAGQNYCGAVPFSRLDAAGTVEHGPVLSTTEMFQRAIEWYDDALQSSPTAAMTAMAHAGRARALLHLGQFDDAAAAAALVPDGFEYQIEHSEGSSRQNNGVWIGNNSQARYSVTDGEGGGMEWRSANDPRLPYVRRTANNGLGFDNTTPAWVQMKYPARSSNVPVFSWIEARLIQAEAALQNGDAGAFVGFHNALRASLGNDDDGNRILPDLSAAGLGDRDLVELHFRERGLWLYATGNRLSDLRRLMRQYNWTQAEAFPTGSYFKGGSYGDDVALAVPVDELNNPNFREVQDQCDTTVP